MPGYARKGWRTYWAFQDFDEPRLETLHSTPPVKPTERLTMRCSEPLRTSRPMLPAAFAPSPPSPAHRPRRTPRSLSLGSLGVATRPLETKATDSQPKPSYLTTMNRRHALRLLTVAVPAALITACDAKTIAYTGFFLGEILVEFPKPVAKVSGVILIVGSKLILTLLDESGASSEFPQPISEAQSHRLQDTKRIMLKRKDGSTEPRKIDKQRYV